MCLTGLALAEMSLQVAGVKVAFGSGVAAAQAVYSASDSMAVAAE